MHISIEEGKTLIIRLMAVGPVVEGKSQRDVWFEVNGEVRSLSSRVNICLRADHFAGPSCFRRR
jgi:pyruvate carboxylase